MPDGTPGLTCESCNGAEALLTIPKTLAINAALDAIDLLAALRASGFRQLLFAGVISLAGIIPVNTSE